MLKTPEQVSAEEIARFARSYPMNARPVQPLNDRDILGSSLIAAARAYGESLTTEPTSSPTRCRALVLLAGRSPCGILAFVQCVSRGPPYSLLARCRPVAGSRRGGRGHAGKLSSRRATCVIYDFFLCSPRSLRLLPPRNRSRSYEHDNFNGRTLSATDTVQNLADTGFNDRASSAVVRGGRWQICSDAYFRGNCVTLGPGNYTSLREMGMNDRISSVREINRRGGPGGFRRRGDRPLRRVQLQRASVRAQQTGEQLRLDGIQRSRAIGRSAQRNVARLRRRGLPRPVRPARSWAVSESRHAEQSGELRTHDPRRYYARAAVAAAAPASSSTRRRTSAAARSRSTPIYVANRGNTGFNDTRVVDSRRARLLDLLQRCEFPG